jgi:hypothetical protein
VKEIQVKLKTILKSSVASAALLAVAAPVVSSQAEAGIKNGNDNALTVNGLINRSINLLDDGQNEELFHVDGGTASSRMRFIVSGSISENVSVGGLYEANMAVSGASADFNTTASSVSQEATAVDTWDARRTEISFSHKTAGRLTIGRTNMSDNNAASAWGGSNFGTGGMSHTYGVEFRDSTDPTASTDITAAGVFGMYDSGRGEAIRYDLPSGLPFSGSVAMENGGSVSAGVNYATEFAGVGARLWLGYNNTSAAGNVEYQGHVGIALNHSSGLGLVARYGEESASAAQAFEGDGHVIGVSYQTKAMSSLGSTHLRFMMGENSDTVASGDESERMHVQFVQNLPAGTSVHVGWEEAEYETTTNKNYMDVSSFMAGVQINF